MNANRNSHPLTDEDALVKAAESLPLPCFSGHADVNSQVLDLWQRTRAMNADLWALLDAADAELAGDVRDKLTEAIAGMSRAFGAGQDWLEWAARHLQIDSAAPDA